MNRAQSGALALLLILVLGLGAFILFTSRSVPSGADDGLEAFADLFLTTLSASSIAYQPEDASGACRVSTAELLSQYFRRPHARVQCAGSQVELGRMTEDIIATLITKYLVEQGWEGKYRLTICNAYAPEECMRLTLKENGRMIPLTGDACTQKDVRLVRQLSIREAQVTLAFCP